MNKDQTGLFYLTAATLWLSVTVACLLCDRSRSSTVQMEICDMELAHKASEQLRPQTALAKQQHEMECKCDAKVLRIHAAVLIHAIVQM